MKTLAKDFGDLLSEKTLATFVEGEGEEAKWRADWSPNFLLGSTK